MAHAPLKHRQDACNPLNLPQIMIRAHFVASGNLLLLCMSTRHSILDCMNAVEFVMKRDPRRLHFDEEKIWLCSRV